LPVALFAICILFGVAGDALWEMAHGKTNMTLATLGAFGFLAGLTVTVAALIIDSRQD
jgi:hypothetical protein